ncbi:MAG: Protein GltF [Pseudomonas sp.]|nr:MAG: Protein GltF [Pseudomonas sp.]
MKLRPHLLISALILGAAGHATAASSLDLAVTGSITPSACEPTLSNGGVFDYGKIAAKDLSPDQLTDLGKRTVAISITCDAAVLMALQGKDNRAGSDYEGNGRYYGLGLVNGTEKLGDFNFTWSNLIADGAAVRSISSQNNGSTWQAASVFRPNYFVSVADNTAVAPIPVTTLNGDLELQSWIAPTKDLTLGNELPIDGSATLTVQYL